MKRSEALLFLCRCLTAGENPDARQEVAAAIRTGQIAWERVVEVASEYWMTTALYWELRRSGLSTLLSGDLLEYFESLYEMNSARNNGLAAHAGQLGVLLNGIDIEPILMKGAGNLASGMYPDPGIRIMDDIDVLVPEERALECWRLLEAADYRTELSVGHLDVTAMPVDEWPPIKRKGYTGVVELHGLGEWQARLGGAELSPNSRVLLLHEGRVRVLEWTNCLILTLVHAYVHHGAARLATVPIRSLYDVALLMRRAGIEIEWQRVIDTFGKIGQARALRSACFGLEHFLAQRPPTEVPRRRFTWSYWQRCVMNVEKPWIPVLHDRMGRNVRTARGALRITEEGKRLRGELGLTAQLRKLKSVLRIYRAGPQDGRWR